jgi:hypothetical protein
MGREALVIEQGRTQMAANVAIEPRGAPYPPESHGNAIMRLATIAATLALALASAAAPGPAAAKGCLKGALVGGVAGHYAGHHAILGAIGGCVVGRHLAKEKENSAAASQGGPAPQPGAPHGY